MKRILSCLLSFVMILLPLALLLSSCGGEEVEETTAEPTEYTVTFSVNGNETKVTVPVGETPAYTGETTWETSEHFYKITGWEPELAPVTSDATYTAVVGEYGLTTYSVRYNLKTGIVNTEVHEGEMPTPPIGYESDLTQVQVMKTIAGGEQKDG